MAKVIIRRGDATIEAELSLKELQELAGFNGHKTVEPVLSQHQQESKHDFGSLEEKVKAFSGALSAKGRAFLGFVKVSGPDGISAEGMAHNMGLESRYQIGGVTGGGVSKVAERYGLRAEDFYEKVVGSKNGVRTVIFKPGKLLEYLK